MSSRNFLLALPLLLAIGCGETQTPPVDSPPSDELAEAPATSDDSEPDAAESTAPNATIEDTIDNGIAMLEAEDLKGFMDAFLVPAELQAAKDAGKYDEMVRSFSRKNAAELLRAMRSVQGKKPTITDDMNIAWFPTEEEIASHNKLAFIQVDGRWYLPNKLPEQLRE